MKSRNTSDAKTLLQNRQYKKTRWKYDKRKYSVYIYIYIIDFGNIRYHATFYETQRSTTEWYSIIALQWRHNERDGVSSLTSLTIVCSTVYSGADQRKHQSSASLAFVRGIHRRPVNSLHKGPVTRKMFSFHDVIVGTFDIIPEVCDIRLSHKHII